MARRHGRSSFARRSNTLSRRAAVAAAARGRVSSPLPELLEGRLLFSIPEPNNSFATAYAPTTPSTATFYLEENLVVQDSVDKNTDPDDYMKFYNLYGQSHLYAALDAQSADGDLYVYDQNFNQLASSTLGGNQSETINVDLPANQYFYVRVHAYSGGTGTDNYSLFLYNDYAGSSMATARDYGTSWGQGDDKYWAYGPKIASEDYLDYRDNVDYVKFKMEAPGAISLRMKDFTYTGNLVAEMQLLDSSGNVLTDTSGTVGNGLNVDRKNIPAGTYYVKYTQISGSDPYTFRITSDYAGDTTATARNLGDITNTSREDYDMTGAEFGLPTYSDEQDLYKFTLDKTSPLDVGLYINTSQFQQPTFGANLELAQDTNGDGFIESNEVFATNTNEANQTIHTTLGAGTYYAVVQQNGFYTSYQIDFDSDLDSVSNDPKSYLNLTQATNVGSPNAESYLEGGFGISPGDITDFYKFTMTSSGHIEANADAVAYWSRNDFTPYLRIVQDSNGNGHYDPGEEIGSGATGQAGADLPAGTYYLMVSGGGGQTDYYVHLDADYAGNTLGAARAMAPINGNSTQTFNDHIEQDFGDDPSDDVNDFYTFTLPSTFNVTLKTTGTAGEDLKLQLIQDKNNNGVIDSGDVLATSDNLNSPNEQITKTLGAGKYFALVSGVNGSTNYTLTSSFTAASAADPDNTMSKVDARPANIKTLGSYVDFSMNPLNDVDLVRFSATAGQHVSFDVDSRNGSSLDTYLRLFNSSGTQLAANSDGAAPGESASKFSYLEYVIPTTGNYYVGVSLNGNKNYDPKTGANTVNGTGPTGDYRMYLNNLGTTAPTVLRVDAGGNSFVDANGDFFVADTGFTGGTKSTTNYAVAGTTDDYLFATNRIGSSFSFSKAVANGTYKLTLNFADPTATAAGQRKFNVFAEGTKILGNFDIVAAAGAGKTAVSKTFNVTVSDGKLDLSFAGVVGNALVSSISLVHT
jgi:hypothetical protein